MGTRHLKAMKVPPTLLRAKPSTDPNAAEKPFSLPSIPPAPRTPHSWERNGFRPHDTFGK